MQPLIPQELLYQIQRILSDNNSEGPHTIQRITAYYDHQYIVLTTNGTDIQDWLMKMDSNGTLFLIPSFGKWIITGEKKGV